MNSVETCRECLRAIHSDDDVLSIGAGIVHRLRHRVQDGCQRAVQLIKETYELRDRAKLLRAEAEAARQQARRRRLAMEKITAGALPRGAPLMIISTPGDGSSTCAVCAGMVNSRKALVTVTHKTSTVRFDADCFEIWYTNISRVQPTAV